MNDVSDEQHVSEDCPGCRPPHAQLHPSLPYTRSVAPGTLCNLHRERLFRAGIHADITKFIGLSTSLPRPTLDQFGTARIEVNPELRETEHFWVRWQPWLESQGYMLPSRYHPAWVPSWTIHGGPRFYSADAYGITVIDAVRLSDGSRVILKVCPETGQEVEIMAYFSSEPRRSDPRNHCCPLLDLLRPPLLNDEEVVVLVMPLLRPVYNPLPDTMGQMFTCIAALAEGLEFMHEHNTAHRDISDFNAIPNVMMDASQLMPELWHPWGLDYVYSDAGAAPRYTKVLSRSRVPVRYYFIDFGLSVRFASANERQFVFGTDGLNFSLPEQRTGDTIPYDAFAADVRMFGDMIKAWKSLYLGLDFLDGVIEQLCYDDPSRRLSAADMASCLRAAFNARSCVARSTPVRFRDPEYRDDEAWLIPAWFKFIFRTCEELIRPVEY